MDETFEEMQPYVAVAFNSYAMEAAVTEMNVLARQGYTLAATIQHSVNYQPGRHAAVRQEVAGYFIMELMPSVEYSVEAEDFDPSLFKEDTGDDQEALARFAFQHAQEEEREALAKAVVEEQEPEKPKSRSRKKKVDPEVDVDLSLEEE